MKKLIYLFLTVLIVACSSDDSNDGSNVSIEGRWNYTSNTDEGQPAEISDCELQNYLLVDSGLADYYFYLNEDENGNETDCFLYGTIEASYVVDANNSNVYIFTFDDSGESLVGTLSGNTLTFVEEYEEYNEITVFTRD
ncbi:MAG: hypothetical protein ACJAYD_000812 [Patiriisocius sp.]|jgi:hypothetical protein